MCHTRNSRTAADGARQFANRCLHRRTYYRPATPDQRRRLPARRLLAATTLFCRLYLQSSQELHRLQSGVDDHTRLHGHPARHTDNAEAMWSGLRTFCTLMMIGAWSIASQWDAGANALTLAAISCVLYSAVAAPFKSLSLLMRTLVLLSLFSFVVKFGLMVQISDLWQFYCFSFHCWRQCSFLNCRCPNLPHCGATDCFMGSFIAVTNPRCMILLIFLTIIWQNRWRCAGVVSVRHFASVGCS